MALPAMAAKIAAKLVLNTDTGKKTMTTVVICIAAPFALIIAILCGIFSSANQHNMDMVALCFDGGAVSSDYPPEYAQEISLVRTRFLEIDKILATLEFDDLPADGVLLKSYYFALYFGTANTMSAEDFVDFFVDIVRVPGVASGFDDMGNMDKEIYTNTATLASTAITDMTIVYQKIREATGREVTQEEKQNANDVYFRVKYGVIAPTYGDAFDEFIGGLPTLDVPFVGVDGFVEPVADWRNSTSSEYGYRTNPVTGQWKLHAGIDLAKPAGTPIYSVLDGTVTLVRYGTTGYGYYLMVDHGGGFVTLYAHCSKLLVEQGQKVSAGQMIALVGTTGSSTGNHLHFETRVNGSAVNPRGYLP